MIHRCRLGTRRARSRGKWYGRSARSATPLVPSVSTIIVRSGFPTITAAGEYLAGEVEHLVKGGEDSEGIQDCLVSAGVSEALKLVGNQPTCPVRG